LTQKKKSGVGAYLLLFGLGFGLAFGLGFSVALTGFIGSPQQTISVVSQPHGSSTRRTSPQSSH
jgi:hypothetical protein